MTVIVGYLPSAEGRAALREAVEASRLREEKLLVVNSSAGGAPVDKLLVPEPEWQRLGAELEASGVIHERRQITASPRGPGEVLVRSATGPEDLLVIGLRRRSSVGKLLLGSTAQYVLMHAECPVLAVRATDR